MLKELSTLVVATSVLLSLGCAYQPYDADKPEQYAEYWCDPTNQKNSLLISAARHQNGQRVEPVDLANQQEIDKCMQDKHSNLLPPNE